MMATRKVIPNSAVEIMRVDGTVSGRSVKAVLFTGFVGARNGYQRRTHWLSLTLNGKVSIRSYSGRNISKAFDQMREVEALVDIDYAKPQIRENPLQMKPFYVLLRGEVHGGRWFSTFKEAEAYAGTLKVA